MLPLFSVNKGVMVLNVGNAISVLEGHGPVKRTIPPTDLSALAPTYEGNNTLNVIARND